MPDREKVIKGLECCLPTTTRNGLADCGSCPYERKITLDGGICDCCHDLQSDALALLKAQEPKVMTLEEMLEGEVYWFDSPGNFILRPVICNMYDRGDSSYLNFVWRYGNFSWKIYEYGKIWRMWTSRPTDAQREAEPWNS